MTLIAFLLPQKSQAIEQDKLLHFSVAYGATLSGIMIYKKLGVPDGWSQVLSAITVMSAGIVKENLDSQFDTGDIKANALGTVTGVAFTLIF